MPLQERGSDRRGNEDRLFVVTMALFLLLISAATVVVVVVVTAERRRRSVPRCGDDRPRNPGVDPGELDSLSVGRSVQRYAPGEPALSSWTALLKFSPKTLLS